MYPSPEILQGLLAAAPDALIAIDRDGVLVYVNDQVERLFGWSRAELLGRPMECLVPARFAASHPLRRDGYVAQPSTRPMGAGMELWARRRDDSEFLAEISLSTFSTANGALVAAAIRDVTIARRTEQRFRAVLAAAPDAIIGVDASGRIELVNTEAERLFGWTSDTLLGQLIEVLVPDSARKVHVAHRTGYVTDPRTRLMGAGLQLLARRRDGSTFPADISLSAISDEAGTTLVLAAVRDVTSRIESEAERRRQALEAQREQSHRLESLGQLAGGVAHDFNNLLGVILTYTTLLIRRANDPAALADLEEIRSASERAAGLTRQLLTFARRDVANPEALEINAVIRSVASMLERTLGAHIELRLDLSAEPLVAIADRYQLEQIVVNLVINARDAMPAGGRLTLSTESALRETSASGDAGTNPLDIVLRVRDDGEGMSPDVVARAFEPFFTTRATGEGTGLGLATVYGIVRQHGGEVTIASEVGVGTTVTVTIPRTDVVASTPIENMTTPDRPGSGERILLVEDEASLRVATARILTEHGYEVLVACDGLEALEVYEQVESIDLILTDVAMPRMRGDALARTLLARNSTTPVVLMSGYTSGDPALAGRVLTKPVVAEVLLRAIRDALNG